MQGRVDQARYVVWIPGPVDWSVSPAIPSSMRAGGQWVLHELAFAAAATGRRVELRGDVDFEAVYALREAVGVAPELPTEPLRPVRGDIVIVAEGTPDVRTYAQLALSGARLIMLVLAPPGLLGWPFVEGWTPESPVTVSIESLARPEHFRAMSAMGFDLWTNSPGTLRRIEAAGLEGTFIGDGRPLPFPDPLPKRYDVVTLANNRWAELSRVVVSRLDPSVIHHEIPAVSNAEVLEKFGEARVLVHPIRIEGASRIGLEARAMGAVPIVLDSNEFGVGLNEQGGAVTVPTLEDMSNAVMELLGNPSRLSELRDRAMKSAREQCDWDSYVVRVDKALSRPEPEDPGRGARSGMGASLIEREDSIWEYFHAELGKSRRREGVLTEEIRIVNESRDTVGAERDRLVAERDELTSQLQAERHTLGVLRNTRVWRIAGWYWRQRTRVAAFWKSGRPAR